MKLKVITSLVLVFGFFVFSSFIEKQKGLEFQAKAYYFPKSKMDLGKWGARLSEAQNKNVEARMKTRLEKSYVR